MGKLDIYKLFSDKNKSFDELKEEIKIKDFVAFPIILEPGKRITYGANVRLIGETDSYDIIPFNYSNVESFQPTEVAKKVENGFRIPDFLEIFGLQEIIFRVNYVKIENTIKIKEIDYRDAIPILLNQYRKKDNNNGGLFINQNDDKDTINNKILEGFFNRSSHTFLHENLLALFNPIPSTTTYAYVWVMGEDPDVMAGDSRFLTHILAISDDSNRFTNIINNIKLDFLEFVIMLKSRRLFDEFVLQRKEAIKSAKAAIMSRNMSHNLGSHVMSYLKTNLGSVKNILKDNVLSIMLEGEKLNPKLFSKHQFKTNKLTLPFLVGIGRFISYLQERQDYIATVSTDYIPYCSSVNFKDFIYDELNSDKRYERHPDRTNLKPDNILLGNIARSEGLGRKTSPTKKNGQALCDIVLKFRTRFDGTPPGDDKVAQAELDQIRNFEFSLPGGTVGRQAIFSILENVIRNSAKHGNWREQGQLELTLDIFTKEDLENEQPDDELKKRLRDDDQADANSLSLKGVLKRFYNGEGSYDYYLITVTDNLVSNPISLKELRKALHEDYVDLDNRMIETNKGIKEMRISAAWLRLLDNDLELSPFKESNDGIGELKWNDAQSSWTRQPPVLYIRLSKDQHNQCHLQYIFCVMRPKRVAFVSSRFDNLSYNGFYFLSLDEYLTFPNKNFEFVVYNDEKKNACERDMKEKEVKMAEENTDLNKHQFKLAKKKFEEEKTLLEKTRFHSSQRFYKLSDLEGEYFTIKDIDDLASSIKTIKNRPEDVLEVIESFEKKTEDIYLRLYQYLSGWDGKEKILIDDDKTELHHDNEKKSLQDNYAKRSAHDDRDKYKNKIDNLLTPEKLTFVLNPKDENIKYRYIKHLEEKGEFETKVINYNKQFDFSEGITGDNSTDRLVRNESKTKLWFYKHLHAMKLQVAVIDERIFSKVTGLDESDFISRENVWGKDLEADKRIIIALNKLSDEDITDISDFNTREQLDKFIERKNLKHPDLSYLTLNTVDARNHLGATYKHKNLHVFSIIPVTEDSERFNLYGINIDKGKDAFSYCIRYATLRWDSDKKQLIIDSVIDPDNNQQTNLKFHCMSIHQGLLDKLYNAFGIEKNDIEAKENLTKNFYEQFIIDATKQIINLSKDQDEDQKISRYFLPGMTIHSGRSKPSEEDMPQHLPFIPYSALEHAVLDCKYSIVELLDSARYE